MSKNKNTTQPIQPNDKTNYAGGPPEPLTARPIKDDFLPRPEDLVIENERGHTVTMTLTLAKDTYDFLVKSVEERGITLDALVQEILDDYIARHES